MESKEEKEIFQLKKQMEKEQALLDQKISQLDELFLAQQVTDEKSKQDVSTVGGFLDSIKQKLPQAQLEKIRLDTLRHLNDAPNRPIESFDPKIQTIQDSIRGIENLASIIRNQALMRNSSPEFEQSGVLKQDFDFESTGKKLATGDIAEMARKAQFIKSNVSDVQGMIQQSFVTKSKGFSTEDRYFEMPNLAPIREEADQSLLLSHQSEKKQNAIKKTKKIEISTPDSRKLIDFPSAFKRAGQKAKSEQEMTPSNSNRIGESFQTITESITQPSIPPSLSHTPKPLKLKIKVSNKSQVLVEESIIGDHRYIKINVEDAKDRRKPSRPDLGMKNIEINRQVEKQSTPTRRKADVIPPEKTPKKR